MWAVGRAQTCECAMLRARCARVRVCFSRAARARCVSVTRAVFILESVERLADKNAHNASLSLSDRSQALNLISASPATPGTQQAPERA